MMQYKPAGIAVFECFQLLAKDDGSAVAIAVHQCERAAGLNGQRGFDNGKYGRNTAACRKSEVILFMDGVEGSKEAPRRRHYFDGIARFQYMVGKSRKQSLVYFLNGHA